MKLILFDNMKFKGFIDILLIGIVFFYPSQVFAKEQRIVDIHKPELNPKISSNDNILSRIEIEGNSIYSTQALLNILTPLLGEEITPLLRRQAQNIITQYYSERGYVTSFAREVTGQLELGTIKILVTEGKIDDINVNAKGYLSPKYVSERIRVRFQNNVFNKNILEDILNVLKEQSNIDSISIQVNPSQNKTGAVDLDVFVEAASIASVRSRFSNGRSPVLGSNEFLTQIDSTIFGSGDLFTFISALTEGSNGFGLDYRIPITKSDLVIGIYYGQNINNIIEAPFDELDIDIDAEFFNIFIEQPLISKPLERLAIGVNASWSKTTNEILGRRFQLSRGIDPNGELTVSVLRFPVNYFWRDDTNFIFARSQLNFGVDVLGSTISENGDPDGRFVSWVSGVEYYKLFAPDNFLLVRSSFQLSNTELPFLEQVAYGGITSVRGYRPSSIVGDNGFFISGEYRYPIWRNEDKEMRLQIVPTIDFAAVSNAGGNPSPFSELFSIGLGLRFEISDRLSVNLHYAQPLINSDIPRSETTIQDRGFTFSVTGKVFEF